LKAVRIHEFGGPEVLRYEDAPEPELAEGDVLVRVSASSVNPVDWKIRKGFLKQRVTHKLPLILGWDVSGTVERLGPKATGFAVGDAVFSRPDIARDGAYAELIAVRASELARKPRSIDHVKAAAVPLTALTAWQALIEAPAPFTSAALAKGQTVLIHGGAGGVGTFAIQIARWRGARVLTTASEKNASLLRELGADQVIDYTKQRFEDVARDVDVVFDTIGGETQKRSWDVVKPGGVVVSIASPPEEAAAKAKGARGAYVFVQPSAAHLTKIAELIDAGAIKPVVSAVFPLADARRAHEESETGHVRGKIVLQVS
jgi:NADPH:quinone reductase-like Zn-dependent oxidoreductase